MGDLPFPYNLLPDRLKPDVVEHGAAFWRGRALTHEEVAEINELMGIDTTREWVCPKCNGTGYTIKEFAFDRRLLITLCEGCFTGGSISGGFKNDFQKLSDYTGGHRCPPGKGEVE